MAISRHNIEELRDIMQARTIKFGDFVLSSGAKSKYYYYGKHSTWRPSVAERIGNILLPAVLESGAEAVGGLELGAVPISAAIGFASLGQGLDIPTFTVRTERKAHGTRDRIASSYADDGDLIRPGRRVAIVDDVITHGGSIRMAIGAVKDEGCEVTVILALVERHEGGGDELRADGYNVQRLFFTDKDGRLYIDETFVQRYTAEPIGVS